MYLARFRTHHCDVVQGLVRLRNLSPSLPDGLRTTWSECVGQLGDELLAAATAGVSVRVLLTPGVSLERTLTACAADAWESRLRRALGVFSRLETVVPGSVELPLERVAFDAASDDFPPLRTCISSPHFSAGDAWLACDFRLSPNLGSLLADADRHGYQLGYHSTLEPLAVGREELRAARVNQLVLRELAGVPPALVTMQQALVDRLPRARWACREYVGVDDQEAAEWLSEALGRLFRRQFGSLGFSPPAWELEDLAYDEELACPACTPDLIEVEGLCATAVDDDEAIRLVTWSPPDSLAGAFPRPSSQPVLTLDDAEPPVIQLPVPYEGDGEYLFVSYRHTDLEAVVPVLRSLQERGWNLWYDRGIPGGSEWNAVLEERLASAHGLLLFLSQAAVESKYVRREIILADSIEKPIVGVQLGSVRLMHGLGLMLGQRQLLRRSEPEFWRKLERALTFVDAA